jgi:hypothetical protein
VSHREPKETQKRKSWRWFHQWNAKKFLQKIKRVVIIIGMLKYAPQLNIDKDIEGAYVRGRSALGFKEDTPENRAYLEFALKRKATNTREKH